MISVRSQKYLWNGYYVQTEPLPLRPGSGVGCVGTLTDEHVDIKRDQHW